MFRAGSARFLGRPANRKRYLRWLGKKLKFKKPSDWCKVKRIDFQTNYGGGLLFRYQSHIDLLEECIPDSSEGRNTILTLRWTLNRVPGGNSSIPDLPLVPFISGILFPRGPDFGPVFILVASVSACPLHAGTGWIVGFVVARINRRTVPAGIPAGEARPRRPGRGPCEPPWPPSEGG